MAFSPEEYDYDQSKKIDEMVKKEIPVSSEREEQINKFFEALNKHRDDFAHTDTIPFSQFELMELAERLYEAAKRMPKWEGSIRAGWTYPFKSSMHKEE